MGSGGKTVAIVCLAIFALITVVAVPMLALLDAQTPIDDLFWTPATAPLPSLESQSPPEAPSTDVRAPRAPPSLL